VALAALIDASDITVTAAGDGAWSDTGLWGGDLPAASDAVLVPAGATVTVDGVDADIRHLRVDGHLVFDPSQSSTLTLDTLEVTEDGQLTIGTGAQPVADPVEVRIRFRSDSDIDVAWDPNLVSRGLVADGDVEIHGQPRTVHIKVAADPLAGDDTLTLAGTPEHWRVGDRIVITGTRYSGWKWDNDINTVRYHGTQDEVRTITAIDGNEITLDEALEHDHVSPRADLKASVANFTRSVVFETVDGESAPVHRRGHVMLRHHTGFDVRYAAFIELGRTDKSVESFALDQLGTVEADSNVRGRYALHFHMTGIDTPREPAMAVGNAVFHSPGWGYVHHASNAIFHDNASFDTFGAGFVAETGDEIGAWTDNIAIKAEGNSAFNPKNGNDPDAFDMGRTGDGFWFQGRMVRAVGNVAASVNHGYVYLHRGSGMNGFPNDAFMLPEALRIAGDASPDDAPIFNFHDNEAFASTVGIYVVKANPNQQHDIHSHLSKFTAWEVRAGAAMEYTSHYLLEDFDIIGNTPEPFRNPAFGIDFGTNTSDMVINRATIEGMETGIALGKNFTDDHPPEINQYVVIDAEFIDVDQHYDHDGNAAVDTIITSAELTPGRIEITLNGGEPLEYLSPATSAGSGLFYDGEKLDSIGASPIPAGTDTLGVPSYDMIAIVSEDGYYRTAGDEPYAVVEEYFTERASGTIHKLGLKMRLGPEVDELLGNPWHAWSEAFERGTIDLSSQPPEPGDDRYVTAPGQPILISPLANDSDPDGDALSIDGVVAPKHGQVFANEDGTLEYRPDLDYVGEDRFTYWATDAHGNFSPATITVVMTTDELFSDRFGTAP
jgi:hypothetical protein